MFVEKSSDEPARGVNAAAFGHFTRQRVACEQASKTSAAKGRAHIRVIEVNRDVAQQRVMGLAHQMTIGIAPLIHCVASGLGLVRDGEPCRCCLCFIEKSGHASSLRPDPAILELVHMKLRLRALTIIACAGLLLTGCSAQGSAPAANPEPEVLSASEAGGMYLDAVCPVNEAWDEADVERDRLRLTFSRGEDDTQRFAAAMKNVATASATAAKALDPRVLDKAGRAWPKQALDEIADVQRTLESDRTQASKVAELDANEAVDYIWQGSEELGTAASAARSVLGLPEDGESACAQWREQAERDQVEREKAERENTKKPTTNPDKKAGADQ